MGGCGSADTDNEHMHIRPIIESSNNSFFILIFLSEEISSNNCSLSPDCEICMKKSQL